MRGATECARRVQQFVKAARNKADKLARPEATDPITQIVLGVFSRDEQESKARRALDRFQSMVVDFNELRVIAPLELAEALGDYPDVRLKCEDMSRALNRIFAFEHTVSLDRLKDMNKRDMLAYLDKIDGLEPYTRARVRLLGLGLHAIPLDEAMLAYARAHDMVDKKCTLDEAQLFLERQVGEDDALDFVAALRKAAWAEFSSAVKKRQVERIVSVPPDRTSRNMLRLVSSMSAGSGAAEELDDDEIEEVAAPAAKPGRSRGKADATRKPAASKPAPARKPAEAPAKSARKKSSGGSRRPSRGAKSA